MKYCVVGDPHLKPSNLPIGEALFSLVETIAHPTIWLGDFLDTKELVRGKCFNALFAYLQRSELKHIILVGNHDYFNLDCQAHSLEALKVLPNVTVVDEPILIDGQAFFPYIHDRTLLEGAIAKFAHPDRTLFAHLEVSEFDFGNGHVCTTGIPLSAVAGFKKVISGHFHKFQENGNLVFLGTPLSHTFGEANQVKYIGLYDTETADLKTAETPFPRHISYEFNCDLLNENLEHWIFDTEAQSWEKNLYRVILTGSQANIDRFPKAMYEKLNIKWISRPSDHAENNVTIEETVSNESQFVKWATGVRKMDEETVKLGLAIMEACK
jgi:hypothetical protein